MTAEDQGWAVDDGTCDACFRGDHDRCAKPEPCELCADDPDAPPVRFCCCNEGYEL